jgi:DNA polymerase I
VTLVEAADRRDYDVEHYTRVLRDNFASRLERAFTAEDYSAVFADPEQPSLFGRDLADVRPVLRALH